LFEKEMFKVKFLKKRGGPGGALWTPEPNGGGRPPLPPDAMPL